MEKKMKEKQRETEVLKRNLDEVRSKQANVVVPPNNLDQANKIK